MGEPGPFEKRPESGGLLATAIGKLAGMILIGFGLRGWRLTLIVVNISILFQ